jgi:hypothetical protein
MLPNLKVANPDGAPHAEGLACLTTAIQARMAAGLLADPALQQVIQASGGLMRTLVRLTQRAAVNALAADSSTITLTQTEAAIKEERADFVAGLSRDDYPILYERHRDKQVSADEAVLRLLQTRALLEYANGDPWCDVHPIALPLVLERGAPAPQGS